MRVGRRRGFEPHIRWSSPDGVAGGPWEGVREEAS